jgi:hypothetical protein
MLNPRERHAISASSSQVAVSAIVQSAIQRREVVTKQRSAKHTGILRIPTGLLNTHTQSHDCTRMAVPIFSPGVSSKQKKQTQNSQQIMTTMSHQIRLKPIRDCSRSLAHPALSHLRDGDAILPLRGREPQPGRKDLRQYDVSIQLLSLSVRIAHASPLNSSELQNQLLSPTYALLLAYSKHSRIRRHPTVALNSSMMPAFRLSSQFQLVQSARSDLSSFATLALIALSHLRGGDNSSTTCVG